MPLVFVTLLGYVVLQLALGFWVSRRIRTEADYIVAGRSLGPLMATSSIFATWFGAETCVGAAGEVYEHGLAAVSSDPYGYGLCLLLFGLAFAAPLWSKGLTTLADLFRERFSPGVERTVAVMLIPGSLLWASAQVRAFGHVLALSGEMSEGVGIAIAAGIAVSYTSLGGMLADAYSDLIQGGILITCLLILAVAVVGETGGIEAAFHAVTSAKPAHVEAPRSALASLNDWAVPVLGSLFAQELVSRTISSRNQEVARSSALIASLVYVIVGSIPVLLGAIAHATMSGIESEQVLAVLARKHMSTFGYVIFSGALISAILSTVDSALLVCGSLVSHNLAPIALHDLSERQKVRLARASVIALSALAYLIARTAESVHGLVEQASAFGSAGVCVAGTFGLFTRRGDARAAFASLFAGALAWIVAAYALHSGVAFLVSLAAALGGYGIMSALPRTRAA